MKESKVLNFTAADVEHVRVYAPRKRRPDMGDLVIYGGWVLSLLLIGALVAVAVG